MHITKHQGRMQRLFSRGHEEETVFIKYLRGIGLLVVEYDRALCYHQATDSYVLRDLGWRPDHQDQFEVELEDVSLDKIHQARAAARGQAPKQFTFSDHEGHFGGSCDGIIHGMDNVFPDWDVEGPGLFEGKTHNEKSFIILAGKLEEWRKHVTDPELNPFTGKGVLSAKIEHYVQVQVYMKYFGLSWCLYMAVCKNTDDLYLEVIHYKPEIAEAYADRASAIIKHDKPPARISSDPSWWECKFCDFREICHRGAIPHKNCRSCIYASVVGPNWQCTKFNQAIPLDFIPLGCDSWDPITNG